MSAAKDEARNRTDDAYEAGWDAGREELQATIAERDREIISLKELVRQIAEREGEFKVSDRKLKYWSRISDAYTVHGQTNSRTYRVWSSMKTRCYNPSVKFYPNYGGRGIKVCERWHSFENFLADMGEKPHGLELDRLDNNGDYCPENCAWRTSKEQNNNKSSTVYIEFRGERKPLRKWAEEVGINPGTLWTRIKQQGWTAEQALTTPSRLGGGPRRTI